MKYNLKKMWPAAAASLVAFTNLSFADADNAQMRNLENRVTALEQRRGANGVINPPGRPQVRNGADLFITADALYWIAHEDGLPLFVENEDQGFTTNLHKADAEGLHWDWDWGFRVGFGYNMPHDGWDLSLTWMRVYGKAHEHEHAHGDDALYPTLTHPGANLNGVNLGRGPYTKAKGHWKLQLNQIDLEMGREFFVSKWLTLRPHFGLRTDWIHQKLEVHYNRFEGVSGQDYEVEMKNHFWGLGIAAGLDTQWGLGGGWSIYGNAAFAVLYGFHELDREDELANGTEFKWVDMDYSYRVSRAVGDLQLGLRWDTMFDKDRFHFGIQAGWEHHIYFSQNQFPRFVDDVAIGDFIANQGDLTFQGWTLSARFDF
ncbi:MAG: hypothetical protein KF898_00215 [Parachlamydiales bacterium]|nr:hypothetical protein [Verrucomicrobiota bacterium]MBX3718055.1 hypothetical protein [Candidatus Acheromyda pituitae]